MTTKTTENTDNKLLKQQTAAESMQRKPLTIITILTTDYKINVTH